MEWVLYIQGIYYLISGLWPIIHIGSFMKVTGPKTDLWLVKTVGAITVAIAITLLSQTTISCIDEQRKLLPVLTAAAFASIDFYYSLKGTISKVYFADGFLQLGLIVTWILI